MLLSTIAGCTSLPSGLSDLGWQEGTRFEHLVVANAAYTQRDGPLDRLHVYIGGDGQAWLNRTTVSRDPTARSLAMELMARDDTPALYLGRPCYHGLARQPPCEPILWTHARYGSAVLDSMTAALAEILAGQATVNVSIYGYSGGGVLALLLARQFDAVDRVITVSAPLDITAWAAHHGFTPLSESIDPARYSSWPSRLAQWHWQGGLDGIVPVQSTERFRETVPAATFVVVPGADHDCCWLNEWLNVLAVTSMPAEGLR